MLILVKKKFDVSTDLLLAFIYIIISRNVEFFS